MDIKKVREQLTTTDIGKNIHYMETTESTNDDAKRDAGAGAAHGTLYVAEKQRQGRGRMFRSWETGAFESIAFSVVLRPNIKTSDAPAITPVMAVSMVEAIRELYGLQVQIKWPNDLFLDGKKLGGILTEMKAGGKIPEYIVIGAGLNINQMQFNGELQRIATSMRISSGIQYDRERLLAEILNKFEKDYELFLQQGLTGFAEKLIGYSCILGREVVAISGLEFIEGVAEGIDSEGNLLLRLEDQRIKRIIYGDVSLKIKEQLKD